MSAEAIWVLAERPSGEHIAQLYSHETVLVESLRMFTTHGVSRGEAVLLVLTPSHRQVLLQHLKADGVDVDGLQRAGQLLLLYDTGKHDRGRALVRGAATACADERKVKRSKRRAPTRATSLPASLLLI